MSFITWYTLSRGAILAFASSHAQQLDLIRFSQNTHSDQIISAELPRDLMVRGNNATLCVAAASVAVVTEASSTQAISEWRLVASGVLYDGRQASAVQTVW